MAKLYTNVWSEPLLLRGVKSTVNEEYSHKTETQLDSYEQMQQLKHLTAIRYITFTQSVGDCYRC